MNEELIRARVSLDFGQHNGSYSYNGLTLECTDQDAYDTARAINSIQELPAQAITMTRESVLTA
jgi:hypothetical protein